MTVFTLEDYSGHKTTHVLDCKIEDIVALVHKEVTGDEVLLVRTKEDTYYYDSSDCRMNDYIDYENIIVDPDEIRFWFEDRSDDDEDEEEEEEEIMSDNNITLEINCPFCGNKTEIVVDADAYKRYQDGALAQVAFPNLNLDDRETLISGLCKKCQKDMFG